MPNTFPPPSIGGLPKLDLWATYYYIHSAEAIAGNRAGVNLLGASNADLGIRLTEKDYCLGAIEGTILVRKRDGSAVCLNYLDHKAPSLQCDCQKFAPSVSPNVGKTRFRLARGPFGDGAGDYFLVPYRSIAVDKTVFPLGTVLYVPDARGQRVVLPDGEEWLHDGYFFAADVGGAIQGSHIDVFQGTLASKPFAPFITSTPRHGFPAYKIEDAVVVAELTRRHKELPAHSSGIVATTDEMESMAVSPTKLKVIQKGDRGTLVQSWQLFLQGQGFNPKGVDGDFGNDTKAATEAFQARHRLEVDGVVGKDTWGKAVMLGFVIFDDNPPKDDRNRDSWPPKPEKLRALTHDERVARFGSFNFRHAPEADNYENIEILGSWEDQNIVKMTIPQIAKLKGGGKGNVRLHREVVESMVALWAAWEKAGLLDRLITWEGMFVARFKRGTSAARIRAKDPTALSNHSWGTAFDVNYEWNKLNTVPALLGEKGCVRELVELANKHGFYWGGHFSSPRDGMHFEFGKPI